MKNKIIKSKIVRDDLFSPFSLKSLTSLNAAVLDDIYHLKTNNYYYDYYLNMEGLANQCKKIALHCVTTTRWCSPYKENNVNKDNQLSQCNNKRRMRK